MRNKKPRFYRDQRKQLIFLACLAFFAAFLLPFTKALAALGFLCGVGGSFVSWSSQFDEYGYQKIQYDNEDQNILQGEHTRDFGEFLMIYATGFGGAFLVMLPASLGLMLRLVVLDQNWF